MGEFYGKEIPLFLRFMRCFAIQDGVYRFGWGEISFRWGFSLGYGIYHDSANFNIHVGPFNLFLKAPMLIKQRDGKEDWMASFGFSIHPNDIHLNWRTKCKIIHFPWSPEFYKRWELVSGDMWNKENKFWIEVPQPLSHGRFADKETHDYTYVLRSGEVQKRKAEVYVDRMEWRMLWFPWLPIGKIRESINISFDGEVGEGTGSWKGGTTGCGYTLKKGETAVQCLRRMESERKFNR